MTNTHQFVDGTNADGSEPSLINTEVPHLDEYRRLRRNMLLREALKQEIQELAAKSVRLKASLDSAKTSTKVELYQKKLRRNNNKVFDLIDALEKIPNDPLPVIGETLDDTSNQAQL